MKPPAKINATISKADRSKAGSYYDNQNCVLCRALKRLKFRAEVQGHTATINDELYRMDEAASDALADAWLGSGKGYSKRVIGLKVRLTRLS